MNTGSRSKGLQSLFDGSAAEAALTATFRSWLWVTAKPEPDTGVDLQVRLPSNPGEVGPSFIAQIKSGGKIKPSLLLKHASAARLRDHVLPAFLFYVNRSTKSVTWIYLEPWFLTNRSFSQGGVLRVSLRDRMTFNLDDPEPSSDLVTAIAAGRVRGAIKAQPSLKGHAQELKRFYKELDPRFSVDIEYDGRREVYKVRAGENPVDVKFRVTSAGGQHQEVLADVYEWGAPVELPAATLEFADFPIFQHLTGGATGQGVSVTPKPAWEGMGTLKLKGDEMTTEPPMKNFLMNVVIRRGRKGVLLELVPPKMGLNINLRLGMDGSRRINISIDFAQIIGKREVDLLGLEGISQLLDGLLSSCRCSLELHGHPVAKGEWVFRLTKMSAKEQVPTLKHERDALRGLEALGQLQSALGFKLESNELETLDPYEARHWVDYAQAYRGISVDLGQATMTLSISPAGIHEEAIHEAGNYILRTVRPITVNSKMVAEVEVEYRMRDYVGYIIDRDTTGEKIEFRPNGESSQLLLVSACQAEKARKGDRKDDGGN